MILVFTLAFALGMAVGLGTAWIIMTHRARRRLASTDLFTTEAQGLDRQLADYAGDVDPFRFFEAIIQVYIYDALVRLAPPQRRRPPPRRR